MAAPVLANDFTTLTAADAATGFSTGALDTDSEVQNTGCVGAKVSNAQTEFDYTLAAPTDYSAGVVIYMWLNCLTPTLDTLANGGLRMKLTDGTDVGYWYLAGQGENYDGGWKNFAVSVGRDFDAVSGTWTTTGNPAQLTAVDTVGGVVKTIATIMGNFNNGLIDAIRTGSKLEVTDGVGDAAQFIDFSDYDDGTKANKFGVIKRTGGVFFLKGGLDFGDGTTTTTFTDTDAVVVYDAPYVITATHSLTITANATVTFGSISGGATSGGCYLTSSDALHQYVLDADLGTFNAYASTFNSMDSATLGTGATLQDCTLSNSGLITHDAATMTNCNVLSSTAVVALTTANPNNITDSFFANNDRAIELTATGTYTFDGITFAGNTFDVYNNSGGSVTINVVGGGDTPTVTNGAGASTTVNNNVSVTYTGLQNNSEVRVYTAGTDTELDGIENVVGNQFAYTLQAGTDVDVVIFHIQYDPIHFDDFTVPTTDATIPVQQIFSRNYSNP